MTAYENSDRVTLLVEREFTAAIERRQPRPADGLTGAAKAIKARTCTGCDRKIITAVSFTDRPSQDEYFLSGLCQTCQDAVFNIPDDESEDDEEEFHSHPESNDLSNDETSMLGR
jgi:RNase P subunit RPR2